ncbi:LysR family transcriptional regulator [Photobacterium japonica]|uniref:LysR family transcriptional regulator n=1 Tax=Photobacterium japonica TaxID=2910235 RepID=UPI003D103853
MKLQLDNIMAFVSVAEEGSFSAAARRLNKSQSTISTSVQNLETDIGYAVFNRDKKRPYLSEKGHKLFSSSKVLLKQYHEVIAVAQKLSSASPMMLTIGIDPFLYHPTVTRLLNDLADAFPQLDLHLKQYPSNVLSKMIHENEMDFAFGFLSNEQVYDIDYTDLFKVNCVWVHAAYYPLHDPNQHLRALVLNNNSDMFLPNVDISYSTWTMDNIETLLTLCQQGKGIALLPEHIHAPYTDRGALRCVQQDQRFFGRQLQASLFRSHSVSAPTVADWIATHFAATA